MVISAMNENQMQNEKKNANYLPLFKQIHDNYMHCIKMPYMQLVLG
jgi:hypothetical protein